MDPATNFQEIRLDVQQGIARITLNRPEKRNPLGLATVAELCAALERCRDDQAVRVIVLTGAGRAFSAGGDLSQLGRGAAPGSALAAGTAASLEPQPRPRSFVDLNLLFTRLGKPTLAMVNGHALGGGLGLVCACDLAIASSEARFGTPEINVSLWPMMIMANIFRSVARKHGLHLILSGEKIDAVTAERIGLVNRVVAPERLEEETMALARSLAEKSPSSLRLGLRAFYETRDLELGAALSLLEQRFFELLGTEDASEGLMAFLEKRRPCWKGC